MVRVEFLSGASSRWDVDDVEWRFWSTRKVSVPISVLSEQGCSVSINEAFPVERVDSIRGLSKGFKRRTCRCFVSLCLHRKTTSIEMCDYTRRMPSIAEDGREKERHMNDHTNAEIRESQEPIGLIIAIHLACVNCRWVAG